MKLNLGCGNKILDGYVNIDMPDSYSEVRPDVEADIAALPYHDNKADEVMAIHVLEHFYIWETKEILKEWVRVLKPGGRLVVEVPCLDKILYHFQQQPVNPILTFWGLYGDPSYKREEMTHRWCFPRGQMKPLFEEVGLINVEEKEPEYHVKQRDMRWEGVKKND